MVPWKKNITIASFEKNDHRQSLERTISTLRVHSEHTQSTLREHSDITQRTPREHLEYTQITPRENTENTHFTCRVHPHLMNRSEIMAK